MSKNNFSFLFPALCLALLQGVKPAQAQQQGGIYSFTFSIDPELANTLQIVRTGGCFPGGYREGPVIPAYVTESVMEWTEQALGEKFQAEVRFLDFRSPELGFIAFDNGPVYGKEGLEGLPLSTFKRASREHPMDMHFQLRAHIRDGRLGYARLFSSRKLRPMITLRAKAFGPDKKVLWKNKAKLKKMGKLKRYNFEFGGLEVEYGQVLTPEMILWMYGLALEVVVKGEGSKQ